MSRGVSSIGGYRGAASGAAAEAPLPAVAGEASCSSVPAAAPAAAVGQSGWLSFTLSWISCSKLISSWRDPVILSATIVAAAASVA